MQQDISSHKQQIKATLDEQQTQLDRQSQLLPLLPYVGQQLITEQSMAEWTQEWANLETRLMATQKNELARYQPLLTLLHPQRLAQLEQLLNNEVVRATEQKREK